MNINVYLKQRRLELGMTLSDVAQRVGVNNSTVSRWESGDIKDMKRNIILKYAEALQISPSIIMGWEQPDNSQNNQSKEAALSDDEEELVTLLDYLDDDYYNLLVEFLALSGLRIGEVIALKDSDIDQEYIHINKTFETNVKMVSDTPKTSASTRDVYLRPELKDCVNRIRSFMRVYKFERGIRTDLFYPGPEGNLLHYDAFRKYLRENSIKCLGRKITPHALRHTTASLLIAAGVPLETVTRMLGHSDSAITKEIYLHLTQELKKRDNDILTRATVL